MTRAIDVCHCELAGVSADGRTQRPCQQDGLNCPYNPHNHPFLPSTSTPAAKAAEAPPDTVPPPPPPPTGWPARLDGASPVAACWQVPGHAVALHIGAMQVLIAPCQAAKLAGDIAMALAVPAIATRDSA